MDPYLGEIRLMANGYVPEGGALSNGALLSVNTYQALYTLLGNTYGGDQVSFGIPNLTTRVVVGVGQLTGGQNYVNAATGGAVGVALEEANIPPHNHVAIAANINATQTSPINALPAKTVPLTTYGSDLGMYSTLPTGVTTTNVTMDTNAVDNSVAGGQQHNNMQPTIVLNYIIALNGIWPTRP